MDPDSQYMFDYNKGQTRVGYTVSKDQDTGLGVMGGVGLGEYTTPEKEGENMNHQKIHLCICIWG